jgi:hypothetical protein
MRKAKALKRKGGFYARIATKGWDEVKEGAFWGDRGLQKRFGRWVGSAVYCMIHLATMSSLIGCSDPRMV